MSEPLIFSLSSPGRRGVKLPQLDVPESELPAGWIRRDLPIPEVAEVDVVRHFVRLSRMNYSVDTVFYPLGSCTMKYNPKVNDAAAGQAGFSYLHPLQDPETAKGAMAIMHKLQEYFAEIGGFSATSLQPSAGAQGELSGILMMRAYHLDRGEEQRGKILVPDTAHGTNPATTSMAGLEVVEIASDERGNLDLAALKSHLDEKVAGLMLTNPNTLGLFDEHLLEATGLVHEAGGLVYGDGANLNAIMGICQPGRMGIDVMHYNLHKTFSTPHGGGGPGSCALCAGERLAPYLPGPMVQSEKEGERLNFRWQMPAKSIGRIKSFWGNFGVMVRAYTYIRILGGEGLRAVAEHAVLNANYLQARLKEVYPVPYGKRRCMHEFVAQGKIEGAPDVRALDISKRLIDYGFHPPTNYFPLIVPEALMIEPTETETRDTLDAFIDAMRRIAEEARSDAGLLHSAPQNAPLRRLDEVKAARELKLCASLGSDKTAATASAASGEE